MMDRRTFLRMSGGITVLFSTVAAVNRGAEPGTPEAETAASAEPSDTPTDQT